MSVRKDTYQLRVEIITDDSKKLAAINTETKQLEKELREAKKSGAGVEEALAKLAAAGKKASDIDLTKVAPAQLVTRSRDLAQQMKLIPASAPEYAQLEAEQKKINDRLATMRSATRGVAESAAQAIARLNEEKNVLNAKLKDAAKGSDEYNKLKGELSGVEGQLQTMGAGAQGAGGALQTLGTKAKALAASGVLLLVSALVSALAGVKDFLGGVAELSPQLEVMDRKAAKVFGEMEGYVQAFAATNAEALGLSRREYIDMAASVQDLLIPLGFERDLAAEVAVETTNAAGKLAEWTAGKLTTAQASDVLRKAYLGQMDGLEALGIKISESNVTDKLKERGLDKLTGASLEQAKVLARLELVNEKTADAQGAFAENGDTAARMQARLTAKIQEQREEMAEKAGPIIKQITAIVLALTMSIIQGAQGFISWAQRMGAAASSGSAFSRIIGTAFGLVFGQVKAILGVLGGLGDALVNLFEGNYLEAAKSAAKGFADYGTALADGVKTGFTEGLAGFNPLDGMDLEAPKFVEASIDFDAAYADLDANGGREGPKEKKAKEKDPAKDAKEKLDLELKLEADAYAEKRLLAEAEFFAGLKDEARRDEVIRDELRKSLEKRLEILKANGMSEGLQVQEVRTEIAQVEAEAREAAKAQTEADQARMLDDLDLYYQEEQYRAKEAAAAKNADINADDLLSLQQAAEEKERTKDELAAAALELERVRIEQRLEMLAEFGLQEEAESLALRDKKLDVENQIAAGVEAAEAKKQAAIKKTADDQAKNLKDNVKLSGQFFGAIADLLGKDEAARKKNAKVIKALKIAEIQANLAVELSNIAITAAKMNAALPGSGIFYGVVQGVIAVARAAAGVIAVNKAERGGIFGGRPAKRGIFGGRSHAAGGTRGYFEDGTVVEVEADELWTVVNKRSTAQIRALSDLNNRNNWGIAFADGANSGAPKMAGGGLMSFDTTPRAAVVSGSSGGSSIDPDAFLQQFGKFAEAMIASQGKPVRAQVVLSDIDQRREDLEYVKRQAAI